MIVELKQEHIPFAMEVKNLAGWNQTDVDWQTYLRLERVGCFLALVDQEPAGTATAIRYGAKLGWVGMVLVHPSKRRLGIGTALLHKTISYLQERGVACIKLDATPMGKQVYIPLGFVDEYEVRRYELAPNLTTNRTPSNNRVRLMTSEDLQSIALWDAEVFGATRYEVITALSDRAPQLCFCVINEGVVLGYLMARPGYGAHQIGPFAARTPDVAEALLRHALSGMQGKKVLVDVPVPNQAALDLVEKAGFSIQRGFWRMYLGENASPGQPKLVYGTSGAEKG